MKEIVILSGKGGTGKTSITAAFSYLTDNSIFCDADVDASDLHLLMAPEVHERNDFIGGSKATIDHDLCSQCNLCKKLCRFDAISSSFIIDGLSCEGCGVCVDLCPEQAIKFPPQKCGEWYISSTRYGQMVHARLGIGEENSGKLVHLIRKKTREMAKDNNHELIVTDGPPGIGCPVIASISGASIILLVVEPSVSGIHDMKRVVLLARRLNVPILICINKYDIHPTMTEEIIKICKERELPLVGKIPFDTAFTYAMVQGMNIFEYQKDSVTVNTVRAIWSRILSTLSQRETQTPEIQLH